MDSYTFEYINENEFKKNERYLKQYNMLAYKKLYFLCYPCLKAGNFLGDLISKNEEKNTESYELQLPTDLIFAKENGNIKLLYTVEKDTQKIILEKIIPNLADYYIKQESKEEEERKMEMEKIIEKIEINIIKSKIEEDKDNFKIEVKALVKNNTGYNMSFIKIEARFYDASENVIDVATTLIEHIRPYNESVEIMHFRVDEAEEIRSYKLKISDIIFDI